MKASSRYTNRFKQRKTKRPWTGTRPRDGHAQEATPTPCFQDHQFTPFQTSRHHCSRHHLRSVSSQISEILGDSRRFFEAGSGRVSILNTVARYWNPHHGIKHIDGTIMVNSADILPPSVILDPQNWCFSSGFTWKKDKEDQSTPGPLGQGALGILGRKSCVTDGVFRALPDGSGAGRFPFRR